MEKGYHIRTLKLLLHFRNESCFKNENLIKWKKFSITEIKLNSGFLKVFPFKCCLIKGNSLLKNLGNDFIYSLEELAKVLS